MTKTVSDVIRELQQYRPDLPVIVCTHPHDGKNSFDVRLVEPSRSDAGDVVSIAISAY